MHAIPIFSFISSLLILGLGLLVLSNQYRNPINRSFFIMCSTLFIWHFFYTFMEINLCNDAMLFAKLGHAGVVFLLAASTHYMIRMYGIKGRDSLLAALYTFSVIMAFIVLFTDLNFSSLYLYPWGYYPKSGPAMIIEILYNIFGALLLILVSIRLYLLKRKSLDDANKLRLKFLIVSFCLFWLSGIDYLPKLNIHVVPVGCFFVLAFISISAFGILRYQLFDINIVIRKGVVYSVLIAFITAIYFALILVLETMFRGFVGYKSAPLTLFIIILFTIVFQPLKNKVQAFADRYFFKGTIYQIQEENVRLREELQRAEKLKAISTLAAGMAHEIKNPLTSIKTFTEYLPKKCADKDFIEKFTRIVGAEVEKINDIVGQLLYFAKPRPPQISPSDIGALINETIDLLNNDFIKHKVKVTKDIPNSVILSIDPVQMKQVFLNLIINAIDAMNPGGGILKVTVISEHETIKISFEDTGAGISQKNIKNVFDPFFSTKDTSTGLGLSIVHGIISNHNGRIEVVSAPGKGTRFDILLPC